MNLTKKEKEALKGVKGGADIYSYPLAFTLRKLEKKGLVSICKAMDPPKDGAKQQPYFGCIAKKIVKSKH